MARVVAAASALVCTAVTANGQTPPDYGFTWHTVGAPGNAPFTGSGALNGRGAVQSSYRMTETELTNSNWIEFCEAYWPFYKGDPTSQQLTGLGVSGDIGPGGIPIYTSTIPRLPTPVTWRMAARFANWLHNGKAHEAWAFESGAYDTSTFVTPSPGVHLDQRTHSRGARFWIPSVDEWLKATYYDPDRNGPGEGGWWAYPDASDEPLTLGPPQTGGETNAGWSGLPNAPELAAGSYPFTTSPWGLLDTSGGLHEMTEGTDWLLLGSSMGTSDIFVPIEDRIGWFDEYGPIDLVDYGFRLASIPAPSSVLVITGVLASLFARRRR